MSTTPVDPPAGPASRPLPDVDYDAMRAGMDDIVPFLPVVGIKCTELSFGRAVCVLPDRTEVHNHIGSLHAGAMFTTGESAAGMAFTGAFADQLDRILPLAAGAQIRYRAVARGDLTVEATLGGDVTELRERLAQDGKVAFPVEVEMRDPDGKLCAEMTVDWHLRLRD
jgi:acyl-coenzyme A thioesterase PaaI-like protein